MSKAEFNIFYVILVVIMLFGGIIEKYIKSKTEPPKPPRPVPQPEEAAGEGEWKIPTDWKTILERELNPERQAPQPTPQEAHYEPVVEYDEAQSLETIDPSELTPQVVQPQRVTYTPTTAQYQDTTPLPDIETDFDLRQAVLHSEILNRKY